MKETMENLKKVYRYGKEYRKNMILFLTFSFAFIIINVLYPLYTAKQVTALTGGVIRQLIVASLIVFAFDILGALRMWIIRRNTQVFFRGTFKKLQLTVSREILRIKTKDLDNHSSGVFVERLNKDCNELSHIFTMGTGYLTGILSNVGMFVAIAIINGWLFLYYLAAALIVTFLHLRRVRQVDKKDRILRKQQEVNVGLTGELVRGVRDIKMLNASEPFIRQVETSINNVSDKTFDMRNTEMRYDFLLNAVTASLQLGLIFLLIRLLQIGNINLATAMVLFSYKNNIMVNLMQKVGNLLTEIKAFNLSSRRVFSLLEQEEFEKESFGDRHLDRVTGHFAFQDVVFGYEPNRPILKHLNLSVNAGETVGIVGKSGVGKTTLFQLLCKMYEIAEGRITLDGVDIRELDEYTLRGNITVIRQNPYIFNMSIRDNLRLMDQELTQDDMERVCRLACLDDDIRSLPGGYDTVVGESGVVLSGGQQQRLAIARALVRKSPIILFDEATSALDNETQSKVQSAIEHLKKDHTVVIIAHRLSTVLHCDRIFCLEDGHVADAGTHQELLTRCPAYRSLFEQELQKKQESDPGALFQNT